MQCQITEQTVTKCAVPKTWEANIQSHWRFECSLPVPYGRQFCNTFDLGLINTGSPAACCRLAGTRRAKLLSPWGLMMKLSSEIMVDDGIGKNGKRGHKDREDCGKGVKSCMSI